MAPQRAGTARRVPTEEGVSGATLTAPQPALLPRHTLVWPAPSARDALLAQAVDEDARGALARWLDAAWPLVVRRPDVTASPSPARVDLGVPLPPGQGRRRLAFALPRHHVARAAPPPTLRWVSAALPTCWKNPLDALDREARALGATLRVFGSAAWHALTGLDYLRPGSDVDVVFRPDSRAQLEAMLGAFAAWELRSGRRIDAEIVFAGERAVAWREWCGTSDGADDRVLVKSPAGAALVTRADLLAPLPIAA